ncbi:cyclase family protein [Burkholderia stagnalis]|uniref:cyclase family protein n=2 Tax=Burkholderia stagnalis TaxID=1503054 RepID=UPI000756F2B8|nr:cyclase family protein [Burkholderia stagnalis]KVN00677.1 cyclase [Burkholderia stagnalis]KWD99148.1 cyclase [Burkholderia stagnalis]KWE12961.1 cyclase [Burkholderia stagnalis]
MNAPRWNKRPPGSNWGDFGPDDQKGRLNWLTPEKVRQGVAEVRAGLSFSLSLPLDVPRGGGLNARRRPPAIMPALLGGKPYFGYRADEQVANATDVVCDDSFCMHSQFSTQWDGLSHVGGLFDADDDGVPEIVFYNGFRMGEHLRVPQEGDAAGGARALGIEVMAQTGVQGRGVLIDLRRHFGDARTKVGFDQLMRVMDADDVRVERGDIVCLHTGFADLLLHDDGGSPATVGSACVLDSSDVRLLRWIDESGLAALAADNHAIEERPYNAQLLAQPGALMPLHELCLFKLGIHLGELWHLTPLAGWLHAHRRNRFLLTAPPLYLRGVVGSPVNPVATV